MKVIARFALLSLAFVIYISSIAFAATPDEQDIRLKGRVFFSSAMNVYGILTEDGKKYHPTKKLPNEYLRDGLEIVVEGRVRDDLMGTRMWGKAFEVKKIYKASKYVGPEEREAIRILIERMDAFTKRDLTKLKSIDVVANKLTQEQFDNWLQDGTGYTLHYVETDIIQKFDIGAKITGVCLFSRSRINSMAVSGNIQYAIMKFTITRMTDGWMFTDVSAYKSEDGLDFDQIVGDWLAKAQEKYGTIDLAKWRGLN